MAPDRRSPATQTGSARGRRISTTAGLAAALLGIAACSTAGTKEHQRRGAEFLVDEAADNGVRLRQASCTEPTSSSVDTVFECAALDEDGISFTFLVTILPNGYRVEPKLD